RRTLPLFIDEFLRSYTRYMSTVRPWDKVVASLRGRSGGSFPKIAKTPNQIKGATRLKAKRGVALHCPGRPGKLPARHYDPAARSSLYGSGGTAGEGSAAPGEKSPRWSAERRASRVMERRAPRKCLAYRVMIRPAGASHAPERFSALRPPLVRGE